MSHHPAGRNCVIGHTVAHHPQSLTASRAVVPPFLRSALRPRRAGCSDWRPTLLCSIGRRALFSPRHQNGWRGHGPSHTICFGARMQKLPVDPRLWLAAHV